MVGRRLPYLPEDWYILCYIFERWNAHVFTDLLRHHGHHKLLAYIDEVHVGEVGVNWKCGCGPSWRLWTPSSLLLSPCVE